MFLKAGGHLAPVESGGIGSAVQKARPISKRSARSALTFSRKPHGEGLMRRTNIIWERL